MFPAFFITGERVPAASPAVLRPSRTRTNQRDEPYGNFSHDKKLPRGWSHVRKTKPRIA